MVPNPHLAGSGLRSWQVPGFGGGRVATAGLRIEPRRGPPVAPAGSGRGTGERHGGPVSAV